MSTATGQYGGWCAVCIWHGISAQLDVENGILQRFGAYYPGWTTNGQLVGIVYPTSDQAAAYNDGQAMADLVTDNVARKGAMVAFNAVGSTLADARGFVLKARLLRPKRGAG